MNKKLFAKKWLGPYLKRFKIYKNQYYYLKRVVPSFYKNISEDDGSDKKVLFISMGSYDAKTEALYAKVYQALGYRVSVLCFYDPYVKKIFELFGVTEVYYFESFLNSHLRRFRKNAESLIDGLPDMSELLRLSENGIHYGKYAASTYMRKIRSSNLSYDADTKNILVEAIAKSLQATEATPNIFKILDPQEIVMVDRGYTPIGHVFEYALNNGIPVMTKNSAHKSGYEIIKYYFTSEDSVTHPQSLSKETWEVVKRMEFNNEDEGKVLEEIHSLYNNGDWFSEVGTQFNKTIFSKEEVKARLGLDLNKKVACVFPHMFWDATFFWGEDIFDDYYDWFVNVLKVAKENTKLNWIIKIHPANNVKAKRDGYKGKARELEAIYEVLGELPSHIKIIDSDSEISTFALFEILDYSLTVRGTVGIETAMFGIATATAGTGRYDRLGFTHDFSNKDEYIEFLKELEKTPKMTLKQIDLARRFAYGVFLLRPLKIDVAKITYEQDETASMSYIPACNNTEDFLASSFFSGLKEFIGKKDLDFLNCSNGDRL